MYVCVCDYTCVWINTHVCACGSERPASGTVPQVLSTSFLETGSLLQARQFSWPACQGAPGICLSLPQHWDWEDRRVPPSLAFYMHAEDQTQDVMLVQQTLYRLGYLPSPWLLFLIAH